MYGITIAFKEYNLFKGVFGSPWIGFDAFKEIFAMKEVYRALRNTFLLNILDLIAGFPTPIILALVLNEVRSRKYKRVSQTILYMPHFLSWVIIGGMVFQIFAPASGVIPNALRSIGVKPPAFLSNSFNWIITYISVGVWQNMGWGTIIYLAAMAGINPELYEAAEVDGASRLRKVWHITLPGIKSTIVILLILSIGNIARIGFERPFILGNYLVADYADVISTFVYRVGLRNARFTIATAMGLFQSVVSLVFLVSANLIARRTGERGIW
jgi:putative aldouronate transport system permease protein